AWHLAAIEGYQVVVRTETTYGDFGTLTIIPINRHTGNTLQRFCQVSVRELTDVFCRDRIHHTLRISLNVHRPLQAAFNTGNDDFFNHVTALCEGGTAQPYKGVRSHCRRNKILLEAYCVFVHEILRFLIRLELCTRYCRIPLREENLLQGMAASGNQGDFLLAIHNRATVALKSSGGRFLIINSNEPTITPVDIFTPAARRRPTLAGRTNMNYLTFAPLKWEPPCFLKIQTLTPFTPGVKRNVGSWKL